MYFTTFFKILNKSNCLEHIVYLTYENNLFKASNITILTLMTPLQSSRKSWDIFAFSSEKIDFLIFAYTNFSGHLKKVIQQRGYVRFG